MAHAYTIDLTNEDRDYLQSLTRQRTIQAQVVDRAKTLLYKAEGMSNGAIADRLDVNINTIKLCLNKYKDEVVNITLHFSYTKFPKQPYPSLNHSTSFS